MDLSFLIPTLQNLNDFGYWLTLLAAFFESLAFVGILIPGSGLIALMGFLSAGGYFHFGNLMVFAIAGAIMGDVLSYYFGHQGLNFFRRRFGFLLRDSYLRKAEIFFKKHGGKSVFLGRFVHPIRPIIPFVAGMAKMDIKFFIFYDVLSAIPWALLTLGVGFFLGEAWEVLATWSSRVGIALLVFLLIGVSLYIIYKLAVKEGRESLVLLKSIIASIRTSIANNPEVQKLTVRHPFFFRVIKNRLDWDRFSGLPLTALSLIYFYFLFHFLGIVRNIIASDPITQVDIRLENLFYIFRHPWLTEIFFWITMLGQWEIILSLTIIVSALIWFWRKPLFLSPFLLTVGSAAALSALGKIVIQRPRPLEVAVFQERFFSFPSGHATIVVALYGFLAYLVFRFSAKWQNKVNAVFFSAVIIAAVGISRLYLGAHYLSDVIGGYFLGAMCLLAGISLTEWLISVRKLLVTVKPVTKTVKWLTVALLVGQFFLYAGFALNYEPILNLSVSAGAGQTVALDNIVKLFSGTGALPKYSEKLDGTRQEPLSFIIIAQNDSRLKTIFYQAGWQEADPPTIGSVYRLAQAAVMDESYPAAPMTPSFWNTAVNDFSFEKPTADNTARSRHHSRFWRTNYILPDGRLVYVGTASLDEGVKWLVTHRINLDLDAEREIIFADLLRAGAVISVTKHSFVPAQLGKNSAGDLFFTDGYLYQLELK